MTSARRVQRKQIASEDFRSSPERTHVSDICKLKKTIATEFTPLQHELTTGSLQKNRYCRQININDFLSQNQDVSQKLAI